MFDRLTENHLWREPGSVSLDMIRDRKRFGAYEFCINGRSGEMASFVAIPVRDGRFYPQLPRIDLATLPPAGKFSYRRRRALGFNLFLLAVILLFVYWRG